MEDSNILLQSMIESLAEIDKSLVRSQEMTLENIHDKLIDLIANEEKIAKQLREYF